jgi:hypothetical protein
MIKRAFTKSFMAVLALCLIIPLTASAAFFTSNPTVAPADPIDDDVYAAGKEITIRHNVGGDLVAAGESVRVMEEAQITGDVFAAGEVVSLEGSIGDDIFAAGREVIIATPQAGDIFAAGETVTLRPETEAANDVYVAGQNVTVGGTIAGTVRATGASITISSGTIIQGDLLTYGAVQPTIEDNVQIAGRREHTAQSPTDTAINWQREILEWVRSVVMWFVAGLALLYLLPSFTTRVGMEVRQKPWLSLGLAVLWLALLIPVGILLLITQIGIPLFFIALCLSGLAIVAAIALMGTLLGHMVMERLNKQAIPVISWHHVLLGTVLWQAVSAIPVLGGILVFALFLLTFGALLRALWASLRLVHPGE